MINACKYLHIHITTRVINAMSIDKTAEYNYTTAINLIAFNNRMFWLFVNQLITSKRHFSINHDIAFASLTPAKV